MGERARYTVTHAERSLAHYGGERARYTVTHAERSLAHYGSEGEIHCGPH
jgi:hypothetical protein